MPRRKKKVTTPAITLSGRIAAVAGIVVALLLLIIGHATGTSGVIYAGLFVAPFVLFCGGLLLSEEKTAIKVTLLVFFGLILMTITSTAMTGVALLDIFG
jgi:hypothetical protein